MQSNLFNCSRKLKLLQMNIVSWCISSKRDKITFTDLYLDCSLLEE